MTTLTSQQITDWLNDPGAIRGTLVEASVRLNGDSVDSTIYLSTFNYVTAGADSPSNTSYEAIIKGGLKYTEKLDITGNASLSVGDIELINLTGELDIYLKHTWTNRPIKAYIGDVRWSRDKFFLIFDGIISDIDSRSRDSINIKIRDKLQRINTPINELTYLDVAPYPADGVTKVNVTTVLDVPLPICFGEVHNVTPILVDPTKDTYSVNYGGSIQGIIELRDNGRPLTDVISYVTDNTTGTFKLKFSPVGTITASLKGDNTTYAATGTTYRNTVAGIIRRIVTGYGKSVPSNTVDPVLGYVTGRATTTPSSERFTEADIDIPNFNAFEAANPQKVGIYSTSKENILSLCDSLASSIGAKLVMSRVGKLQLLKLSSPPVGTPFIITEDHVYYKQLSIVGKTEVQGDIVLRYCKSWTVQPELVTNIPVVHKQLFAREWLIVPTVSDAATKALYNLTVPAAPQECLLCTLEEATAEAQRRLALFKNPHTVYRFTGTAALLDLKLGDAVQLINRRFGLTGEIGVGLGTVISLQPDWASAKIIVEVFI